MEDRLLYPIDGDPPTALTVLGGMSRSTFYELTKDGQIEVTKVGRRSFVTGTELERFVASLATPSAAGGGLR